MKILILAAGKSKRFFPFHNKMFFEFGGVSVIERLIHQLKKYKLDDIVVVGRKEEIERLRSLGDQVTLAFQEEETGMKGALMAAKGILKDDPFLLISSNDVVDPRLFEKVIDFIRKRPTDGFLVGKRVSGYFPGGYIKFNPLTFQLEDIIEKPEPGTEPSEYVNLVFHYHPDPKAFFEILESTNSDKDDLYEVALKQIFLKKPYFVMPYEGFWQPIKYPWHVPAVMKYVLEKISTPSIASDATIASTAVIKGNVYIGPRAKILDYAVIQGPVYIGEGSIIGNHCLVRDSMLGKFCTVGFGSEICRSYLRNYVSVHTSYVGDSVIDNNVNIGALSATGNLRLDEEEISVIIQDQKIPTSQKKLGAFIGEGVKIGVNTTLHPGMKVGKKSFISSGVVISKDIPEESFVKNSSGLEIIPNKKV